MHVCYPYFLYVGLVAHSVEAISEALVKKALAEEDSVFLKSGGTFPHKTTAAQFVSIGLELEEAQYVFFSFLKNEQCLIIKLLL